MGQRRSNTILRCIVQVLDDFLLSSEAQFLLEMNVDYEKLCRVNVSIVPEMCQEKVVLQVLYALEFCCRHLKKVVYINLLNDKILFKLPFIEACFCHESVFFCHNLLSINLFK